MGGIFEYFILLPQILIQLQYRSNVATSEQATMMMINDALKSPDMGSHLPIAVIRRTPNGHNFPVKHQLVTFEYQLMCTGY
jgi:hypothetical protein